MIRSVSTPVYGRVTITATDGKRYHADLSSFRSVYCFPRDDAAWSAVSPDSYGLALVWPSRFEVHVDQVIGLADRVDEAENAA